MGSRVLVAGLTAVVLTGCSGGGDDPAPKAKSTPDPVEAALDEASAKPEAAGDEDALYELLSDRAMMLERGEGRAFSLTSKGAQRARDRQAARRAKRIALERVSFTPDDLTTAGRRATVTGTFAYRVRGMKRPFRTPRRVQAIKTSDGWRVTEDRPRREPLPWEIAPFRAFRTRHVVLLAPHGMDVGPLRSGLEDAYREIRRDLPRRDLPPSVLAIAARDHRQAEQLAGRIAKGVIALANVSVEWGPAPAFRVRRVLAQRMIVIDGVWRTMAADGRQATLVHEMTHTALNPDTSLRTPPWLVEGVALHVSNDDRREEASARAAGLGPTIRLSAISRPDSIFKLTSGKQGAAYAAASAAAEAIVERRGTRGLFRLYDAFNDSRIRGVPGAKTTDRVMRRAIGMSLAELERTIAGG